MRPGIVVLVALCAIGIGCRDERAAREPAVRAPEAPAPPGAEAYELDVIAEAEPDEGPPPLTVRFIGYLDEEEGGPWRFHWDFGDGSESGEQNPTHTYEAEGDYTAVLTVTDRRGNDGSDEIDVFVEIED